MSPLLAGDDLGQALIVGLALLVFIAILACANAGETHPSWAIVGYSGMAGLCAILAILAALNAATIALTGNISGNVPAGRAIAGNALWFAGAVAAPLLLLPPVRRALSRVIRPFRPESPVNAIGAAMYVLVVVTFISLQITTDQLKAIKESGSQPSLLYIIGTNQLPFLVVSFAGVGIFIRRSPGQAMQRLGLYWPGWRWIGISAIVAVGLVIFGVAFDYLIKLLTPGQAQEIDKVSQQLLSNVSTPWSAAILALAAGIGEETLFRGAVQPRLGIVAAALLFAVLHTQYAISLASLEIFILGIALGWLRNRAGATGAIVAHAGYDLILLMIPFIPLGHH